MLIVETDRSKSGTGTKIEISFQKSNGSDNLPVAIIPSYVETYSIQSDVCPLTVQLPVSKLSSNVASALVAFALASLASASIAST